MIKKISIAMCIVFCSCIGFADEMKMVGAVAELNFGQESFVQRYVNAVNTDNLIELKKLIHPRSLENMTAENQNFFDDYFNRSIGRDISQMYKAFVKERQPDEKLMFEGRFVYPIRPTHMIQINADDNTAITLNVIEENEQYFEVLPYPAAETIKEMTEQEILKKERARKAKQILQGLDTVILDELKEMLKNGHKISAIKRVREITGEGLALAKEVVDLLEK